MAAVLARQYPAFLESNPISQFFLQKRNGVYCVRREGEWRKRRSRLTTVSSNKDSSQSDKKIPTWANPDSDEPPPWARGEVSSSQISSQETFEIPFYAYLLASAVTAIAAIGSIFEYANQKPIFGVLNSDSIFYTPILGFFVITGIPTSAFLWFKSVQSANKAAEEQDRKDGLF